MTSKKKLIQLFLKWLKLKNNTIGFESHLREKKTNYLLKYFQFLLRLLIKQQIINSNTSSNKLDKFKDILFLKNHLNLSQDQIRKILQNEIKIRSNCGGILGQLASFRSELRLTAGRIS